MRPQKDFVCRILPRVESLEAAVRYYRDVMGLALLRHDPRLASFRLLDGQTPLEAEVVIVRVELPEPVTEAGLKLAVAPVGKPLTVKLTAPLKPLRAPMVAV